MRHAVRLLCAAHATARAAATRRCTPGRTRSSASASASDEPRPALLRVRIPSVAGEEVDALEDALLGSGALSVTAEDAEAGSARETPLYHSPGAPAVRWRRSTLSALFMDVEEWAAARPACVRALGGREPAEELSQALDADWEAAVRASYTPVRLAPGLWVVPSWAAPPEPAALNVLVEPGLAFGTGEHPTTRLCAAWLQAVLQGGERVMDYGSGSGVLALAALKLGASWAATTDTDPVAVASTLQNAALNGLSARLQGAVVGPSLASEAPCWGPPGMGTGARCFDVVVANILAGPLEALEPRLALYAKEGARLALSGLLPGAQADRLRAVYAPHFGVLELRVDGDWALLTGVRNSVDV